MVAALQEQVHEVVPAERRGVAVGELLGVPLVRGVELRGLHQVHQRPRLVAPASEVVAAAREMARLALPVGLELRALHRGLAGSVPPLGRDEAAFGRLPQLGPAAPARPVARRIGVRFAGVRRVVELLVELPERLEQLAARGLVGDARRIRRDDLRRAIERAGLPVHLRRRRDRPLVFGRQVRDALPDLGGRAQVFSMGLVKGGELLLESELLLQIDLGVLFLFVEVREIVPAVGALENSRQRLARRLVGPVDGEQLLPGVDGALGVAEVALAESRDLAQAIPPRFDRLARSASGRQEDVTQLGVVALRSQVVLHPRKSLGVHGIRFEDLAVFLERVGSFARLGERLRLVEGALDLLDAGGAATGET